jgi:hypothetical protein
MPAIPISSKTISENPELEHFREAVEFLENAPPGSLFPKKWEASAMSSARQIAHELLETNPNVSLKETLTTVFSGCESGLSGEVMMKITQQVIAKWEKMHLAAVPQLESETEFA